LDKLFKMKFLITENKLSQVIQHMIDHEVEFLKTLSDDLGTDIYDDEFPQYNYIGDRVMSNIVNIKKIEVITDDTKLMGGSSNRVIVVPVNIYYISPKLGYIDFSEILQTIQDKVRSLIGVDVLIRKRKSIEVD
jgi:hypothetical protein